MPSPPIPPLPSVCDIDPGSSFLDNRGRRHIKPYTNIFKTNVKGRWVGLSLLEVFSREFAVVETTHKGTCVSNDFLINCMAYATKMVEGTLSIEGRERECVDSGNNYWKWIKENMSFPSLHPESQSTITNEEKVNCIHESYKKAVCELGNLPSLVFEAMPKLTILRQRDKINHVMKRTEPSIDLSDPNIGGIEIISVSFPNGDLSSNSSNLSFIAVNKPSSVPIHPSGRFHKNTLLVLLESTFCGKDDEKEGNDGEEHTIECNGKWSRNDNKKQSPSDNNNEPSVNGKVPSYLIRDVIVDRAGMSVHRTEICAPSYDVIHEEQKDNDVKKVKRSEKKENGLLTSEYRPVISMCHDKVCEGDRARLIQMLPSIFFNGPDEERKYGTSLHISQLSDVCKDQQQQNSVKNRTSKIMKRERLKLYIVHRLDRCTSGVVVMALDSNSATAITESFTATTTTSSIPSSDTPSVGGRTYPYLYNAPSAMVTSENCKTAKRNKLYFARVRGDFRLFLESLKSEKKMGLDPLSPPYLPLVSTSIKEPDSNEIGNKSKDETVVVVNGGIYCSSFQHAGYWCLTPEEQQVFENFSKIDDERNDLKITQQEEERNNEVTEIGNPGIGDSHQKSGVRSNKRSRSVSSHIVDHNTPTSAQKEPNDDSIHRHSREEKREVMRERMSGMRGIDNIMKSDIPMPTDTFIDIRNRIQKYDKLKSAVSSFEIVKVVKGMKKVDSLDTIIMCIPHTGRTHQLRVHLSALGYPIVGDTKYDHISSHMRKVNQKERYLWELKYVDANDPEEICLHAYQYTVGLKDGNSICVEATPPSWINE